MGRKFTDWEENNEIKDTGTVNLNALEFIQFK